MFTENISYMMSIFLSQVEYSFISSTNLTKFNEVFSWKKKNLKKQSGNEARKLNLIKYIFSQHNSASNLISVSLDISFWMQEQNTEYNLLFFL